MYVSYINLVSLLFFSPFPTVLQKTANILTTYFISSSEMPSPDTSLPLCLYKGPCSPSSGAESGFSGIPIPKEIALFLYAVEFHGT